MMSTMKKCKKTKLSKEKPFCTYCFGVTEDGEMSHAVDCGKPRQYDAYAGFEWDVDDKEWYDIFDLRDDDEGDRD